MKTKILKAVLGVLLVATLVFFDYKTPDKRPFWGNPNETSRVYCAVGLIDAGKFDFSTAEKTLRWPESQDHAVAPSGNRVSDKAPLTALLSVPVYGALRLISLPFGHPDFHTTTMWMRFWLGTIPMLILLLTMWQILKRYVRKETAIFALLILTFATMNATFSFTAMGHLLSEMLLALSVFFLIDRKNYFVSGLFAGLAGINEYPMMAVAAILLIYAIFESRDWKSVLKLIAGGLPSLAILLGYNAIVFGSPFLFSYDFVPKMGVVQEPFYALGWDKIWGVLFSDSRGFFFYSPVYLLSFLGIGAFVKERKPEAILFGAIVLFFFGFLFGFKEWAGGWTPGSRHLIPMIPFLTVFLAKWMDKLDERKPAMKTVFLSLAIFSLAMNVLPKLTYTFYPDKIPNPTLWAGMLSFYLYYIYFPIYANIAPLIRMLVYSALLIGGLTVAYLKLIRFRFGVAWIVSPLITILMLIGVYFLPQRLDTQAVAGAYWMCYSVDRTFLLPRLYSGEYLKVRAEFPQNQELAETAFHKYAFYTYMTTSAKDIATHLKETEAATNVMTEETAIKIRIFKDALVQFQEYRKRFMPVAKWDTNWEGSVIRKLREYEAGEFAGGSKEKAREMFEYRMYAYLMLGDRDRMWNALDQYMMLLKEWF